MLRAACVRTAAMFSFLKKENREVGPRTLSRFEVEDEPIYLVIRGHKLLCSRSGSSARRRHISSTPPETKCLHIIHDM